MAKRDGDSFARECASVGGVWGKGIRGIGGFFLMGCWDGFERNIRFFYGNA